ncbi:proline-rich transmembrane protein 1-like isoform X2 [Octopus sinensis]|uniref:Proline-rich transmembrane protein 1-like isoform X2 n=1 Tax=Octopus sinensis TaxID=2607531 RepID=A0A6P7U068_9MOLL|nr:proline-rich transmembrane protein 1-like isoform X2 [Octopus sinensis]
MEANIRQTEEPNDGPPGYYENPGYLSAFEHPTTSGHPAQAGCPPQPGYLSQPGYPPHPGYPPQPGYLPPYANPITMGYTPSPYYPSTIPVQHQPLLQQQQQQTVIIQNERPQYFDNNLTAAILVTIFCFFPTGIPAIIYASKANTRIRNGDIAGANEAKATARRFIIVSILVGSLCFIAIIVLSFVLSRLGYAYHGSSSANNHDLISEKILDSD